MYKTNGNKNSDLPLCNCLQGLGNSVHTKLQMQTVILYTAIHTQNSQHEIGPRQGQYYPTECNYTDFRASIC